MAASAHLLLRALSDEVKAMMDPVQVTSPNIRWHPNTSSFSWNFEDLCSEKMTSPETMKTYMDTVSTKNDNIKVLGVDADKFEMRLAPTKTLLLKLLGYYAAMHAGMGPAPTMSPLSLSIVDEVEATRLRVAHKTDAWSDSIRNLSCHILLSSTAATIHHVFKTIPSSKHNPLVLQCLYYRLLIIVSQFGDTRSRCSPVAAAGDFSAVLTAEDDDTPRTNTPDNDGEDDTRVLERMEDPALSTDV